MLMGSLAQLSSDPTLLQQMASSKCPAHLKSSRRALSLQFAMEKGTCVSDRLELGMMAFTLVQNGTLVKELIAMLFNSHSQKFKLSKLCRSRRWWCIARGLGVVRSQPFQARTWVWSCLEYLQFIIQTIFSTLKSLSQKGVFHSLGSPVGKLGPWVHPSQTYILCQQIFDATRIQLSSKLTAGRRSGAAHQVVQTLAVSSYGIFRQLLCLDSGCGKRLGQTCQGLFRPLTRESNVQAQHRRIHESWSSTVLSDTVSAAKVLVTTLWIFLHPQDIGLTGQVVFLEISLWVLIIMLPVCDSGFFLDANDASENARNLKSWQAIGCMWMDTLEWRLASWRVLLALMRVSTVAWLISDCRKLKRLAKSGRVWTEAYWRLPMRPLRAIFSSAVTLECSSFRWSWVILIGWILLMHSVCERVMLLLGCWNISIPVKVKLSIFWDPKGYTLSKCWSFDIKRSLPPQNPSSTWMPMIPSGSLVVGHRRMNVHGQNGDCSNSKRKSSSRRAWSHKYGCIYETVRTFGKSANLLWLQVHFGCQFWHRFQPYPVEVYLEERQLGYQKTANSMTLRQSTVGATS